MWPELGEERSSASERHESGFGLRRVKPVESRGPEPPLKLKGSVKIPFSVEELEEAGEEYVIRRAKE
ncbi:MAG: hypothetical protein DRJ67_10850 [Thermoprotei archaeon]|mgnify:CR=1 FL=1|nr:MAG: hypothetical protein DRJ67_10850 [Thermoprotei archaeon]